MEFTDKPFCYSTVPLDDRSKRRSIRVLELLPDPNPTSVIQCNLHAVSLDERPCYEAISYFWGPRYFECSITCNGANLNITRSLHRALQRVRHPTQSRWVWADAICINQSDDAIAERISQVSMMRDIYENAKQVLIWLGAAENNSHQAIYIIRQLAKYRSEIEAIGRPSCWASDQLEAFGLNLHKGTTQKEWTTLQLFFDRPWFKRVWTVQEVAVARKAVLFCGDEEIPWDEMVSGLEIGISSRLLTSKRALNPDSLDFFDPAHAAQLRHTQVLQDSPKYSGYNLDSLLSYLLWFRPREATNPLDKVFALLGLIDKHDIIAASIVPDYKLTAESLYTSVTIKLLQGTRTLDVLSAPRGSQSSLSLPSWVPNWSDSSISTMSLTGQSRFNYSATGTSQASVQISPDNRTLYLKGHIIDSIVSLAPILQKSSAFYDTPMTSWRDSMQKFSTVLDKLSDNQKVLMEWEVLATSFNISQYPTGESLTEVFHSTIRAGLPQEYNMKSYYEDWRGNVLPGNLPKAVDSSRHPRLFKGAVFVQVLQDAWAPREGKKKHEDYPTMAYGRRLGKTKGGYLALLPGVTRVGDVVALCEGGKTPLVLRSRGYGNLFELVGDCYVHGVMNGEMFRPVELSILTLV
ncbi:Heterokaryon incompatibility protein (HET) domain containing protein [Naviculisporaceae sp. PSN 640]